MFQVDGAHHLISEGIKIVLKRHGHASEHLLSGPDIVACLKFDPHAKNSSNHQRRKNQRFSQLDLPTSQYTDALTFVTEKMVLKSIITVGLLYRSTLI